MPSTKCWDGRGSTEQRLEEGCIQLTPATSGCWEERSPLFGNSSYSHRTTHRALRCRTPCYGQEWFGTKWSLFPPPRAAITLTALCRERFLVLQRFERVARDGDEIPAWECSPLRSPTEPTPWAKHSCRGRRCCPPLPALQPPNTRRARSQLGLTRIGGSGARLGVVPRKRSRGCGRAHAHPFTGITPLLYQGVPVLGWFLPAESVPGIPGLCPEAP